MAAKGRDVRIQGKQAFVGRLRGGSAITSLAAPSNQGRSTPAMRLVGLGVVLAGLMASFVVSASATAAKTVDSFIGSTATSTGSLGGLFNQPRGVAVNNSTGDLYVVDGNNHRVQQFDAAGNFIRAFGRDVLVGGVTGYEVCTVASSCKAGTTGTLGGEFSSPQGVDIDQSTGALYVSDQNNLRIQKFDATGTFLFAFGKDVVAGNPETGFEVCSDPATCKVGVSGALGGELASSFVGYPSVIPVGAPSAGQLLVADPGNRRVQQFTSAGAFVRTWGFDVVQPGGSEEVPGPLLNERQTIALAGGFFTITGGTFTLTFNGETTAPIDWNASASAVDAALELLPTIGSGNVSVTGGALPSSTQTIEFVGLLAGSDVAQLTGNAASVITNAGPGLASLSISTIQIGGPGPAFESCSVAAECKTGVAGNGVGQFGTNSPTRVAADTAGGLYAVDGPNNRVQRFVSQVGVPSVAASVFASSLLSGSPAPTDIVLGASGRLLVVKPSSSPAERRVLEVTNAGVLFDTHMVGSGLSSVNGIALRVSSGRLYASSQTPGHRVYVLDDDGAPAALGVVLGASNVDATSATLQGSVNSNSVSLGTSYRLEVSRNGIEWITASTGSVGAGTSAQGVSGPVADLKPNTSYRVRIITNKGFGNADVSSAEVTFTTDAVPPDISGLFTPDVEDTSVKFLTSINPNSTETRYRFEWGQGNFSNKVPVPDGFLGSGPNFVFVTQEVTGLEPSTEYQVRAVAISATEGVVTSPTKTFTTRAVPTPPCPNAEVRVGSSAALADCRAYELVSPPYKVGGIGVGRGT